MGRTFTDTAEMPSPDVPVRALGRWRFFALALTAVAALTLPLMFAAPAIAATAHSTVTTETDDDTGSTTPPNTGDNATTPPTPDAPTITLADPGLLTNATSSIDIDVENLPDDGVITAQASGNTAVSGSPGDSSFHKRVTFSEGPSDSNKLTVRIKDANGSIVKEKSFGVNVLFAPSIVPPSTPLGKNDVVAGFGANDASVTVHIGNRDYSTTASHEGEWAVSIDHEFSRATATATQKVRWPEGKFTSSASKSVPITVDLTAPAPPKITAPAAGATVPPSGATISGSGEPGATVTVFVGAQSVCKVDVPSSGKWSCTAAKIAVSGKQKIVAKADDKAGNSSGDGPAVSVSFGSSSSPSDPPANTPSDEPSNEQKTPENSDTTPGEKEPEPKPSTSDDNDSKNEAAPPAAPPNGPGPWNHATPFTESLPPALGMDAVAGWARALLLAVLTIALILIPARMLAGTLARRRVAASGVAFTGRNRTESEFERAPMLAVPGRIAMIVMGIAATGALTIFANPVDGRPAYLRLLLASIIASAIINAAAAWLPRILSHVWQCGFTEVRFNPRWLLLVATAVLASRVFNLHPALLFALVTTVRVPTVLNSAVLARLAFSRIGSVFVVGVAAWLLASFVPQGGGFFTQMLIETANITALVGIGSAAIMMVPLGRLSGRAIFAWSRPLWLAAVLAILTALFVMLGPSIENWRATGNVLAALALVLAFAALGISVWLWKRYVQPMLASS